MNTTAKKIISAVRLQDLILGVVCCLSIYLFRAHESFTLQPAWRRQLNSKAYGNGRFPRRDEWLPSPVLTDLDGDGSLEVVLLTNDRELEVSRIPERNVTELRLPDLMRVRSITLISDEREERHFSRPVALETGYLSSPKSKTESRTQVIVVVLANWTVICYDYALNLLWKHALMTIDKRQQHYFVKAMGVLITSHSFRKGDEGSVIVGGSFGHVDHDARLKSLHSAEHSENDNSEKPNDDLYTHFSTFALRGSDGAVQWHHLPGDFEQKFSRDVDQSSLHWKLTLKRGKWHTGEVHWSKYAGNIIRHMPHSWSDIQDTRFDLSDLSKAAVLSHTAAPEIPSAELAPLKDIIDFDGEHLVGLQYGGMTPHSRHEHVKHPSAVVVHNHEGIEVLDINTGRPLTHLNFENNGRPSTFVDINKDNTIEEVYANFVLKCQVEVSTIKPRPKAVFTGPLCESPFWWGGVSLSNLFYTPEIVSEDTHLAVSPVVVNSIARSRGVFQHLWGKALPSERKGYDSIFLTSTGKITSYSPSGHPNWQVSLPVSWSGMTFRAETEGNFAMSRNGEIYFNSFQPSMKAVSLQLYAKRSAVLVSGWDSVALVDLRDGFVLSSHSLPCQPIQSPIVADFNGDGWTDFVISCPDSYIGFELHKASNITYSFTVAFVVILSLAFLVWCCQISVQEDE